MKHVIKFLKDSSLIALENLTKIESLNLSFCPNITDDCLKNLNFKLKDLLLAGDNKITNDGLIPLIKKSSNSLIFADFTLLSQVI